MEQYVKSREKKIFKLETTVQKLENNLKEDQNSTWIMIEELSKTAEAFSTLNKEK